MSIILLGLLCAVQCHVTCCIVMFCCFPLLTVGDILSPVFFIVRICSSTGVVISRVLTVGATLFSMVLNIQGTKYSSHHIMHLSMLIPLGGGSAGKGWGFDAWDYPRCRAFDHAKRPRGRDIWLWPTEAWYQFRSSYQVRPSRLPESHAVGERYEVFLCFNRHNPIL